MSLTAGDRLGPYQILEPLGAGGMGEVYRAKDLRLERTVAVEILCQPPGDESAGARALPSGSTRRIGPQSSTHLYDLDVGADPLYLAMELLEGETLQQRLERGALDLPTVVDIALALADALDAAHTKGVVHRDIKPANIFLTSRGPKILDFGLAKSATLANGDGQSVGVTRPAEVVLTDIGVTLGTIAYHVAGTASRPRRRSADRSVFAWTGPARDRHRHAGV